MTIQYAILGLLSGQPLSGYDLKKIISDSDIFYWSGNNNQIYNSLVRLHEDGLVTQEIQYQENLPARKVYTITDKGRADLRQWVLTTPELPELHSPFLIQLAFTGVLTDEEIDSLLAKYEDEIDLDADDEDDDIDDDIEVINDDADDTDDEDYDEDESDEDDSENEDEDLEAEPPVVTAPAGRHRRRAAARPAGPPIHEG